MYPEERIDFEVLGEHWGLPAGTLAWAVLHDWLVRQRRVSAEFGEVRGELRMVLELALRDVELGAWLRGVIARDPVGAEVCDGAE